MDNIEDLPQVSDWLNQFEVPDKYLAEYMLKKIRYVSFEEFEKWIQSSVHGLLSDFVKYDKSRKPLSVAIFPVTKPLDNTWKKEKEFKPENDSSGRIGHALKNIERDAGRHVELSPRLDSMKANRVKHIIYVDDFIGTGDRFLKFWKTVPHSVKVWRSKGWCKIWLVSYAAHEAGLKKICNRLSSISSNYIRSNLLIEHSFINENKDLKDLCLRYGRKLTGNSAVSSYGRQYSPIIFQHGCPNNAPGILWCKGKPSRRTFKPLFSNRSIHENLYPMFTKEVSVVQTSEDLWFSKHHALATNFLDSFDKYKGKFNILIVLSYLNSNKPKSKLRNLMIMTDKEFFELMKELEDYGLIKDSEKFEVTRFGKDILKRGSRIKSQPIERDREYKNFYPSSFLGFQREV
jgi:hypothetical protein